MTRVAAIDTNVVAAGLMTARQDSPTARILDGMLTAAFPFALSEALLAEYREVLNRPALCKRHGLSSDEIDSLLATLAEHAIVLEPVKGSAAPDSGDQHLWDLLASHGDLCLVTGDRVLLESRNAPAPLLAPATFAAELFGCG
ncbi:MAG: putative toxin-antitoxin system toxin component, PIN family [Rhodanobacteraceae bacterium]|nr:MAG: putative toxin-antitoxin system toxin component, PIN family [Rhodanobacteraceae bacterium]